MNRPIKFRVWDKLLNKMISDQPWINFDNPEYEFMQFTGLVDKNKKEIYEGDYVKEDCSHSARLFKSNRNEEYTLAKVMWLRYGWHIGQSGLGSTSLNDFTMCDCCPCGLEVVGNIFENPKLNEDYEASKNFN